MDRGVPCLLLFLLMHWAYHASSIVAPLIEGAVLLAGSKPSITSWAEVCDQCHGYLLNALLLMVLVTS